MFFSYRKVNKSPCGHAEVLLTSDCKEFTRSLICVRVDFHCCVILTHVDFTGVNKIETIERFRVPFTANVKRKLRISQNRNRSAKNSSKQLL